MGCLLVLLASCKRRLEGGAGNTAPGYRGSAGQGAATRARGQRVLLFTARWCATCHQLRREAFESPAGKKLLKGVTLKLVDFDEPGNRRVVLQHAVTGLPTTVFLKKDGAELDRIVGFEGREAWLAEAGAILGGRDGLAVLEDQLRREPRNVTLLFKAGYKLLQRGREREAQRRYDEVLKLDPTNRTGFPAQVILHRARFLVRVKLDYPGAIELLTRSLKEFPAGKASESIRYWLAWSYCKASRPKEAVRVVDAWVEESGRSVKALVLAAELRHRCNHELKKALAQATAASRSEPRNDWAWYLVAALSHARKQPRRAIQAVEKAIALKPEMAFYRHEKRRFLAGR